MISTQMAMTKGGGGSLREMNATKSPSRNAPTGEMIATAVPYGPLMG